MIASTQITMKFSHSQLFQLLKLLSRKFWFTYRKAIETVKMQVTFLKNSKFQNCKIGKIINIGVRHFSDNFETLKRSLIRVFSVFMTVPLRYFNFELTFKRRWFRAWYILRIKCCYLILQSYGSMVTTKFQTNNFLQFSTKYFFRSSVYNDSYQNYSQKNLLYFTLSDISTRILDDIFPQ